MSEGRDHLLRDAVLESAPLALGLVAFVLCVLLGPERMDDDFLNAAVQIIPFLLLALALETRLLSLTTPRGEQEEEPESRREAALIGAVRLNRRIAAIYAVAMLIGAETAGLVALDSKGEHGWLGPWLLASIVAGMVIVGTAALLPRRR